MIRVETRRRLKLYLLSLAVLVTLAVGASRVYLGVHWPSDVIAGWSAGAAWAVLWWCIAIRMQRKGAVEKGHEESTTSTPLRRRDVPPENDRGRKLRLGHHARDATRPEEMR